MGYTCKRILSQELSNDEVEYLKKRNDLIWKVVYEYLVRDKKLPIFPPPEWEQIQIQCYLARDLESFEVYLDEVIQLIQRAEKAKAISEDLMKSTLESNEVLRSVARLYNVYWETKRKAELAEIAGNLQRNVDGIPSPIEKVEKTLRGSTGIKDITYYIVDNLYPTCRRRHFSCQKWFVGWADPPEFASPNHLIEIVCNEALHQIPNPFTKKRVDDLAGLLRDSLDKQQRKVLTMYEYPDQRLRECVYATADTLKEGYGHAFIGFSWMEDKIPEELPIPRQMGKEGTPYFESYHFTKWFHDHWKEFLGNPSMTANDWAWQCIKENETKFLQIAKLFLVYRF